MIVAADQSINIVSGFLAYFKEGEVSLFLCLFAR